MRPGTEGARTRASRQQGQGLVGAQLGSRGSGEGAQATVPRRGAPFPTSISDGDTHPNTHTPAAALGPQNNQARMAFSPGDAAENAQVAIRAARVSAKLCPFTLGFGKNGAKIGESCPETYCCAGEGRRGASAPRARGWGGARARSSAAATQLRRSMAGEAAHLLVWRPGPRGGRAGRREAGGPGHNGGGGRAPWAAAARTPALGGEGGSVELAADFHAILCPADRLTDLGDASPPPTPRPFWPTALLSPSLSPDSSFPWCSQKEEKKKERKKERKKVLQSFRTRGGWKERRKGGTKEKNSTSPMRMRGSPSPAASAERERSTLQPLPTCRLVVCAPSRATDRREAEPQLPRLDPLARSRIPDRSHWGSTETATLTWNLTGDLLILTSGRGYLSPGADG
ncbi:PREDICTED: uncharacterized protein LOC105552699 [Mandrillus leucophaeus]|uniref:uncharacterized protein LOC105552699 n=1 Tax=Mandrillus leucophaeus TaxID=9568 RepID=UPI0005F3A6BB|nr:PREDICTED: uncharacterized protein LOC105552699 [Mandrillus leucophaeus]